MLHIGIDVHQKSSVFNVFDPAARDAGTHRSQKFETTAKGFRRVLEPLAGRCEVVFEVGPIAQWVAALVRPYAVTITVANLSRIHWLFRYGRYRYGSRGASAGRCAFSILSTYSRP